MTIRHTMEDARMIQKPVEDVRMKIQAEIVPSHMIVAAEEVASMMIRALTEEQHMILAAQVVANMTIQEQMLAVITGILIQAMSIRDQVVSLT